MRKKDPCRRSRFFALLCGVLGCVFGLTTEAAAERPIDGIVEHNFL
jgi:hypothetical protein